MTQIKCFWNEFKENTQRQDLQYKEAFQFGAKTDWLADLVLEGKKTATCSAYDLYDMEGESLPQAGEYSIVLNSQEAPLAVIQTESVEVCPMSEVSEAFALAEGEGDYREWWQAHKKFFTDILEEYDKSFSPDMLLVCERFKKVYSR